MLAASNVNLQALDLIAAYGKRDKACAWMEVAVFAA